MAFKQYTQCVDIKDFDLRNSVVQVALRALGHPTCRRLCSVDDSAGTQQPMVPRLPSMVVSRQCNLLLL